MKHGLPAVGGVREAWKSWVARERPAEAVRPRDSAGFDKPVERGLQTSDYARRAR
jgi:hypothetical protein